MKAFFDDQCRVFRPVSRIRKFSTGGGNDYLDGEVVTAHGIVSVYSQSDYSRLDFSRRGNLYIRNFKRGFSARGLVTLARRFAAERA